MTPSAPTHAQVVMNGARRYCVMCEGLTPVARINCDVCGLDPFEAEELLANVVKDDIHAQDDLDTAYWARRSDILGG